MVRVERHVNRIPRRRTVHMFGNRDGAKRHVLHRGARRERAAAGRYLDDPVALAVGQSFQHGVGRGERRHVDGWIGEPSLPRAIEHLAVLRMVGDRHRNLPQCFRDDGEMRSAAPLLQRPSFSQRRNPPRNAKCVVSGRSRAAAWSSLVTLPPPMTTSSSPTQPAVAHSVLSYPSRQRISERPRSRRTSHRASVAGLHRDALAPNAFAKEPAQVAVTG